MFGREQTRHRGAGSQVRAQARACRGWSLSACALSGPVGPCSSSVASPAYALLRQDDESAPWSGGRGDPRPSHGVRVPASRPPEAAARHTRGKI
jgi:hypothetical protein